jgi:hypothetical protein
MTGGIDPEGRRSRALEAFLAVRVAEGYRIETHEETHAIVVRGDSFPRRLLGRRRFVVQVDEGGMVSMRPAQQIRH